MSGGHHHHDRSRDHRDYPRDKRDDHHRRDHYRRDDHRDGGGGGGGGGGNRDYRGGDNRDNRDRRDSRGGGGGGSFPSSSASSRGAPSSHSQSSASPASALKPKRGQSTAPPAEHRDPPDKGWYFTQDQLSHTPSVAAGMSDAQVKMLLTKAIEFLQNTGMKMRLPQLTIATAVVYFQRFYVVHSLKKYDIFKMGATALFLAGKVEETPKKLKEVILTAWEQDPRRKPEEMSRGLSELSSEFLSFKDKLLDHERELLRTVAFNLAIDHPYKYLLQSVKAVGGSKELAHFAWNFINDSLKTNLCLQYRPQVIGVAVLDLTSKAMKIKLPGPPEKPKWWFQEAPYFATSTEVDDVSDQLLALYEGFTKLKQLSIGERLSDPALNSQIMRVGSQVVGGTSTQQKRERSQETVSSSAIRPNASALISSRDSKKPTLGPPPPPTSSLGPVVRQQQPPPPPPPSH